MNRFLDCGCCLKDDGTRVWCPTCEAAGSSSPVSAGSACPCGGEGYPGIAHDMETLRGERDSETRWATHYKAERDEAVACLRLMFDHLCGVKAWGPGDYVRCKHACEHHKPNNSMRVDE